MLDVQHEKEHWDQMANLYMCTRNQGNSCLGVFRAEELIEVLSPAKDSFAELELVEFLTHAHTGDTCVWQYYYPAGVVGPGYDSRVFITCLSVFKGTHR